MSASKRKGTAWESAIVDYLRANGVPHAERRAQNGAKDRGDIAGVPGVVFEAKSAARVELGPWLLEAEAERANDGADLAVVWHKRRGKTSAGDAYVTMSGATLVGLLRAAGYIAAPPPAGDPDKLRRAEWVEADRRRERLANAEPNPLYDPTIAARAEESPA
jgi:hypothetical protein